MKLNALFILVLFWAIFRVTSKSLKFEKLTRFTSVVIPIYSVIMFIVTMIWNLKNFIVLLFLFIVSIFIAIFQVSKANLKKQQSWTNMTALLYTFGKDTLIF